MYAEVYTLLRERMADDNDIPDTGEVIAAALDTARAALMGLDANWRTAAVSVKEALAAIDALREGK